jgi:homocysteine S-methyltransferase
VHDPIAQLLQRRPLVIVDGALATELERRGVDLRDELWSARALIEQPALIRSVHREYFEAGADVAITASYQASFEAFARRGIDAAAADQLFHDSVALATTARDEFWASEAHRAGRSRPLVAASIGPYGAMLADGSEYRGHYGLNDAALRAFHRPRLQVLANSGADLLACETIPSLREALVLADLVSQSPGTAAWISFSCQDAQRSCEGQPIAECVARLNAYPQILAIGVNCTRPQFVTPLLEVMRDHTDKPLLVYPNSGEHYDGISKRWLARGACAQFAGFAREWYAAGARLIGGCCRTTPADISGIRAWAAGPGGPLPRAQ